MKSPPAMIRRDHTTTGSADAGEAEDEALSELVERRFSVHG